MAITEKYPENMPWDTNGQLDNTIKVKWLLTKSGINYTFTKSSINSKYIYIQKDNGVKKAVKEYSARFTFQRLFDDGYLLAAVT